MDEKNKNILFTAVYIILILLILTTEIKFIWANDAVLKNNITVVAGLLVLIWLVFTVFYWIPRNLDFQNPKITKLGRAVSIIMIFVLVLGSAANTFIQDHALRWILIIIELLASLIAIALYVIDWRQRWAEIRRKE